MPRILWSVLLSVASCSALAQTAEPDEAIPEGPPNGWELGLAAIVSDSIYAGEGTRVQPIPLVTYQGDRFSFRGLTAAWKLTETPTFELSAIVKLRFDGFKVDDLGQAELARNGIDYRLLEDRKEALDIGVATKWVGNFGELELEALADVSDQSGGQEVALQYSYPVPFAGGMLMPNVGYTWQSKDMANYYYGTLDEEVARGVVDYKPGAVSIPHVGVSYFRPIGEKWSMMAMLMYSSLPDEIERSPLVEPDTDSTSSLFIGFSRGF